MTQIIDYNCNCICLMLIGVYSFNTVFVMLFISLSRPENSFWTSIVSDAFSTPINIRRFQVHAFTFLPRCVLQRTQCLRTTVSTFCSPPIPIYCSILFFIMRPYNNPTVANTSIICTFVLRAFYVNCVLCNLLFNIEVIPQVVRAHFRFTLILQSAQLIQVSHIKLHYIQSIYNQG